MVVGKYKRPRCFSSQAEIDELPVAYRQQRKAWMTKDVFDDWMTTVFMPAVSERQFLEQRVGGVLFLVDNASSHAAVQDYTRTGRFIIKPLPPNTTSLIQPMDQGVISKAKRIHRTDLVRQMLVVGGTQCGFFKRLNVRTACLGVAAAWEEVTRENVFRAFKKILKDRDPVALGAASLLDTPPSSPRDHVAELGTLLRQHPESRELSDDKVWQWFDDLQAAEAVRDEDDEDGEEDDEAVTSEDVQQLANVFKNQRLLRAMKSIVAGQ